MDCHCLYFLGWRFWLHAFRHFVFCLIVVFLPRYNSKNTHFPTLINTFRKLKVSEATSKAICTKDVYGPPDPKSSLRLITFYIPQDETDAEKEYRLRRAQVQDWNHVFWTAHNIQFTQVTIGLKFILNNLNFQLFRYTTFMSRPKKSLWLQY